MSSDESSGERQVSDELLRRASEVKKVRALPDALFGGTAPQDSPETVAAEGDSADDSAAEPAGTGASTAAHVDRAAAGSDAAASSGGAGADQVVSAAGHAASDGAQAGSASAAGEVSAAGDGEAAERKVLVVIADSLAYFGPKGGLAADHPRIWPNLVAAELDWDVELVARIGWTCRDAYWALIGDPRVWAAVPRAGAVVFATGGMDSLPSPLPTALRELIRYVRPAGLRRRVRDAYNWLQPKLSPLGWPVALPPSVSVDYLEQSRNSLAQLRPELPVVGVLPSVHKCEAYACVHTGREPMVAAVEKWAAEHSVPLVDLGEAVRDNVFHGEANPDGIHWGWEGHSAVARAMVKVLSEASAREGRTA